MPSGEEILALVERIDRASNDLEGEAIDRLHRQMDGAFRALERELRTTYPELQSIGGLVAAQRKTLVLEKLGATLDLLDPARTGTYTQLFQELLTLSNDLGGSLADQMLGLYEEDLAALDPFTGIAAEAIANVASESVRRLYRYSEDFRDKASVIVGQGVIQGWGAAKVATALRSELGLAKGKAETIARTEVMSALNQGAIARYQEAGIEYVQWIIAPSEGLCGYCANRNMRVYKAAEVVYPIHPRCRCSLSPYSPKWQQMGLTDDAFAEQYRQEGMDQLKANGVKPQSGPTSFEKNAGLDAPPQAVWSPGDPPLQQTTPPRRRRQPEPATTPPTPPAPRPLPPVAPAPARPAVLPSTHLITTNPRYRPESLDEALNAIESPGAPERVQRFRDFVDQYQIQAVLHDENQPGSGQFQAVQQLLVDKKWAADDEMLRTFTQPVSGADGYTAANFNHIVVNTSSATPGNRGKTFAVNRRGLNGLAERAIQLSEEGQELSILGSVPHRDTSEFLVWVHEMGHQVHHKAGQPNPPDEIAGSVTDYGSTNEKEWFAEHFGLWLLDAERYRAVDPVGAKFIEDTLEAALKT